MDAMTNETNLMGIMTQVTAAQATIDDVTVTVTEAEMSMDTVEAKIETTDVTIDANEMDLVELQAVIETQMIAKDYFERNDDEEIELSTPNNIVGTFMHCPGEVIEFHLAMADEAGRDMVNGSNLSMTNTVTSVKLLADGDEVAASIVTDDFVRGHQHSLFYKAANDTGSPIAYTIDVAAIVVGGGPTDTFAKILENNLQWGYRTYNQGYILDTNPVRNLC